MDYKTALEIVEADLAKIGHKVNPEGLTAMRDNADEFGFTSPGVRAAYYVVMDGFRKLLAPRLDAQTQGWVDGRRRVEPGEDIGYGPGMDGPDDTESLSNCDDYGTGEGRYHGRM